MLNIFYNYHQHGPGKVIDNLCKGLSQNEIEFSKNKKVFGKTIYLSTNSDLKVSDPENTIIGPNIWFEDKVVLEQNYKFFLVPSKWVKDLIVKSIGIDENKVIVWAVGIDTDYFSDTKKLTKELDCFIYSKDRHHHELVQIKDFLISKNLKFDIIYYGQYKEYEFLDTIRKSRFCIILDNTESQGIAIQEIMSSNLPLFVWNKSHWTNGNYSCNATSIPYWDESCGVFFESDSELHEKFKYFYDNLENYNPRDYVLKELNLSLQAKKLIDLFNYDTSF